MGLDVSLDTPQQFVYGKTTSWWRGQRVGLILLSELTKYKSEDYLSNTPTNAHTHTHTYVCVCVCVCVCVYIYIYIYSL